VTCIQGYVASICAEDWLFKGFPHSHHVNTDKCTLRKSHTAFHFITLYSTHILYYTLASLNNHYINKSITANTLSFTCQIIDQLQPTLCHLHVRSLICLMLHTVQPTSVQHVSSNCILLAHILQKVQFSSLLHAYKTNN
jgi:hypothetical protein